MMAQSLKTFFYISKRFFAAWKIRFFRACIRRIGRCPAQIFCNVANFRVFLKNGGRIFRTGNHNRFGFFFYKAKAFFQPPSAKIHLAHKIQDNAKERKNQYRKKPCKFKFIEPGLVELSFVIDSLEGASIAPKPLDLTSRDSGSASILDGVARIGNGTIYEERSNNVVGTHGKRACQRKRRSALH